MSFDDIEVPAHLISRERKALIVSREDGKDYFDQKGAMSLGRADQRLDVKFEVYLRNATCTLASASLPLKFYPLADQELSRACQNPAPFYSSISLLRSLAPSSPASFFRSS